MTCGCSSTSWEYGAAPLASRSPVGPFARPALASLLARCGKASALTHRLARPLSRACVSSAPQDGAIHALVGAMGCDALERLWYLGLSDNAFTDAGLAELEAALAAGGLRRLEFLTASSGQSSQRRQESLQDAFTNRLRRPK